MPRKFLVGMSYVLANYVSELVGGLLGLIPTKYQLNNTLCSVGSNQKAIGIKQRKELKKMSEKTKKNIRIGLSFAQVVVQSLIVYHAYEQYKLTKEM